MSFADARGEGREDIRAWFRTSMETPRSNPSCTDCSKKEEGKKKRKKVSEFEYCKVCKLNHDQGQRHKYFPGHKKSLSVFFSKFETKLSDVRFFLKNPTLLRSEHASRNRLWCVFCDVDIDEHQSSLACSNAINHLASADHLKNLKHFLWKFGGGTDYIDKFRITDSEVDKWEKKCKSLKSEAVAANKATFVGPPNDIHNELNYVNADSFIGSNDIHSVNSSISNNVIPLQCHTNEYQVSNSGLSGVANSSFYSADVTSCLPLETHSGTSSVNLSSSTGIQTFTQIFVPQVPGGNVHTGAPPPWFGVAEESQLNVGFQQVLGGFASSSNKSGKSKKLNPKRVGAAWAERRKMEMEMEKRGELVKKEFDANWLPNFGRVWQSGSRKESRKQFEFEKQNLPKVESVPTEPVKIPYISKRMEFKFEKQNLTKVESEPVEVLKIQPYISKRMELELEKQKLPKVESEPAEPVKIQPYISKWMAFEMSEVESEPAESVKIQPYISKRMEFELEKQKLPKVENEPAEIVKIQPYISKGMQRDASK